MRNGYSLSLVASVDSCSNKRAWYRTKANLRREPKFQFGAGNNTFVTIK